MDEPIREAWPKANANLVDYELGFTQAETVVHIRYTAAGAMDPAAVEMMTNLLRRVSMELTNGAHRNGRSRRPSRSKR